MRRALLTVREIPPARCWSTLRVNFRRISSIRRKFNLHPKSSRGVFAETVGSANPPQPILPVGDSPKFADPTIRNPHSQYCPWGFRRFAEIRRFGESPTGGGFAEIRRSDDFTSSSPYNNFFYLKKFFNDFVKKNDFFKKKKLCIPTVPEKKNLEIFF